MSEAPEKLSSEDLAAKEANAEQKQAAAQGELQMELEKLKTELKESQNKYLYLYADFENYKKRVIKERSDLIKFGHESLVRDLLQVTDNLDRALEHASNGSATNHATNNDALVQGIKMVNQQLKDTLSRYGVQTLEALGQKFDPEKHEAVGQEKATGDGAGHEDGAIIREHQKGYMLHGRLLRPARVVVATK